MIEFDLMMDTDQAEAEREWQDALDEDMDALAEDATDDD
jgi:hypothetical protein